MLDDQLIFHVEDVGFKFTIQSMHFYLITSFKSLYFSNRLVASLQPKVLLLRDIAMSFTVAT